MDHWYLLEKLGVGLNVGLAGPGGSYNVCADLMSYAAAFIAISATLDID